MNILVTGGAGFIGSHVIERFLGSGHSVVCLDNFDAFYDPALKRRNLTQARTSRDFTLVEGDVRDPETLRTCFSARPIDVVVHLAARAGVRPSIENPELYYDVNVIGTLRLLEEMRAAGVKKLVFASSSSVYGNNPRVPFSETDNVDNPISPYAASKKAGELLCYTYRHLYNFDIFCLRFFTVFGPRQRPDMAIHQFIRNISEHRPITLFGDGSSRRDYTYISDIVHGVEQAVVRVRGYENINLGGSRTTSLLELVRMIETALGERAAIEWKPMQAGDVMATCASILKGKKYLDYHPETSVEDAIRMTCGNWQTHMATKTD